MDNEKPNKIFNWKEKLDGLDHLPGEALIDKTAGWNKLQDRLQGKLPAKKLVLRWFAAASILLVIAISLLILNKNDTGSAMTNKHQTLKNTPAVVAPSVKSVETANVFVLKETERKRLVISKVKIKSVHQSGIKPVPAGDVIRVEPDPLIKTHPEIIAAALKPVDSAIIVAALPAKKKLRVVHINDLGKPGTGESHFLDNTPPSFFVTQLFKRDGYSGSTAGTSTPDHSIKIKLTSSN